MVADAIELPELSRYKSAEHYHYDFCHEATHWTGHPSRLDRNLAERDRASYSKEELIAEIGAAFLAAEFGLQFNFENEAASYIDGWITALKRDSKLIFQAASQATKAIEYLNSLQPASQQGAA